MIVNYNDIKEFITKVDIDWFMIDYTFLAMIHSNIRHGIVTIYLYHTKSIHSVFQDVSYVPMVFNEYYK